MATYWNIPDVPFANCFTTHSCGPCRYVRILQPLPTVELRSSLWHSDGDEETASHPGIGSWVTSLGLRRQVPRCTPVIGKQIAIHSHHWSSRGKTEERTQSIRGGHEPVKLSPSFDNSTMAFIRANQKPHGSSLFPSAGRGLTPPA